MSCQPLLLSHSKVPSPLETSFAVFIVSQWYGYPVMAQLVRAVNTCALVLGMGQVDSAQEFSCLRREQKRSGNPEGHLGSPWEKGEVCSTLPDLRLYQEPDLVSPCV